jgi:hypothetical protein
VTVDLGRMFKVGCVSPCDLFNIDAGLLVLTIHNSFLLLAGIWHFYSLSISVELEMSNTASRSLSARVVVGDQYGR